MLLSMLMVLLYFYRAEQEQSAAHIALTEASIADNRIFAVQKKSYETGVGIRGAVKIRMEQKRIRRCYVLNPAGGNVAGDNDYRDYDICSRVENAGREGSGRRSRASLV